MQTNGLHFLRHEKNLAKPHTFRPSSPKIDDDPFFHRAVLAHGSQFFFTVPQMLFPLLQRFFIYRRVWLVLSAKGSNEKLPYEAIGLKVGQLAEICRDAVDAGVMTWQCVSAHIVGPTEYIKGSSSSAPSAYGHCFLERDYSIGFGPDFALLNPICNMIYTAATAPAHATLKPGGRLVHVVANVDVKLVSRQVKNTGITLFNAKGPRTRNYVAHSLAQAMGHVAASLERGDTVFECTEEYARLETEGLLGGSAEMIPIPGGTGKKHGSSEQTVYNVPNAILPTRVLAYSSALTHMAKNSLEGCKAVRLGQLTGETPTLADARQLILAITRSFLPSLRVAESDGAMGEVSVEVTPLS